MKEIKEMAKELRKLVRRTDMVIAETQEGHPPMLSVDPREVLALADKYDPPRPEPGTVVWCRKIGTVDYFGGVVAIDRSGIFGPTGWSEWDEIEYTPARIAGPMQEIVDIPAVKDWPIDADSLSLRYSWPNDPSDYAGVTIFRREAERLEAES